MSGELTRREALKAAAAVTAAATLAPLGALAADVAPVPPPPRMCGTCARDLMYHRMTGEPLDIPDFLRRDEQEMG